MNSKTLAAPTTTLPSNPTQMGTEGVVEIGLLLPAKRAAALLRLASDRHESVGQVLRKLIDRELAEAF
jgi:hypothetical protein